MANHKSAAKRARQTIRKNARNRSYRAAVRSTLKKFRLAIAEGSDQAAVEGLMKAAQSGIAKAASKGLVHKNNAARNISRMSAYFKKYISNLSETGATAESAGKKTAAKKSAVSKKKKAVKKAIAKKKKTAKTRK